MFKKDNLRFGMLLGFIAPLLSFVAYYFWKFYPYTLSDCFGFIAANKSQITAISVPCLVLNIALFTIYINTSRDKTAKGIFALSVVYGILILLLKLWN